MMKARARVAVAALGLSFVLITGGCKRFRKTRSKPKSDAYAEQLKGIAAKQELRVMHWPNYADYQPLVQKFYDDRNFEVAWLDDSSKPTPQATAFIKAFEEAGRKGLKPDDYDAALWPDRVKKLAAKNDDDLASFDAAMTVSVMRYISDLRIGRVNPTHFNFDINVQEKKYDLPEFLSDNAVDAEDVPRLISSVEPDSDEYRQAAAALVHYEDLARAQSAAPPAPLPTVTKSIPVGGAYGAIAELTQRLAVEGDLAAPAAAPQTQPAAQPGAYTADLAEGVKHFQARHGLSPDGKLSAATIKALNIPLSIRALQLADSLERLRWLPNEYLNAPLQVNLPEFVLRGYEGNGSGGHREAFKMNVVVGQVIGEHQTPVFAHMMKFLIFRPYWNVPISIIKKELTPHLNASGIGYLASKNFETVDSKGDPVSPSVAEVERGGVTVREKPGPKNSLGLVKFMFPNEYDIYMHSTPATQLFARSRRDFSHGCVRLEHPDELAAWVLRDQGDWPLDKVQDAMNNGPDNHQVNLKTQIPVVIFYTTARVGEDSSVDFFDDIYGYDKSLEAVLAKGMPYPSQTVKVDGKSKGGDTN